MGRDRFAEYSSQRLARSAFERLFNGHLDPQNPEAGEMQIAKKLEERLPNAFSSITLDPSWAHGGQIDSGSVWNWLNSVFGGQAQQAAEKALKCILLNYGRPFPHTHDIAYLLSLIDEGVIGIPAELEDAAVLTRYAVATRYPGTIEEVTPEEYEKAVELASMIVAWAENMLTDDEK